MIAWLLARSMANDRPVKCIIVSGGSFVGRAVRRVIDPGRVRSQPVDDGHSNLVYGFDDGRELAVNSIARVLPADADDDGELI
jgi:hypothetical protein